jgi:ABC-2 type transport system permease protein
MSAKTRRLGPTVLRILRQLLHDHRTVAMLLLVPVLLLFVIYALVDGNQPKFDRIGLVMLGVFPFVIMFLVTSIAMLRERTSGTLERLLSTPLRKADLLFGYGIAFGLAAVAQASVSTAFALWVLGLDPPGNPLLVLLIAAVDALLGVALGLLASAFARTEFQAVQFMPVLVLPQLLACGLFAPRDQMAGWLEALSNVFPLTYAVEALQEVGSHAVATATLWRDIGIVTGVVVVALVLGAATLRRRTP